MNDQNIRDEVISFFEEAIKKWNRLIYLYNQINKYGTPTYWGLSHVNEVNEANSILGWFQDNYSIYVKYSDFDMYSTENGKKVRVDQIFNVIHQGANIQTISREGGYYGPQLDQASAQLRGQLASVKKQIIIEREIEIRPIMHIKRIFTRLHLMINELKMRGQNKKPLIINDEYDVQYLLYGILRLYFDDIRKEDYVRQYAGSRSKIDIVLKEESIAIETKFVSKILRDKEIGDQLLIDIGRYQSRSDIHTLICFIYDPNTFLENPKGLMTDLSELSSETLKVDVYISPPIF